jgi:hypothetical protein
VGVDYDGKAKENNLLLWASKAKEYCKGLFNDTWLRLLGKSQLRPDREEYKIDHPYLRNWSRSIFYMDNDLVIYEYRKTIDDVNLLIRAGLDSYERDLWIIYADKKDYQAWNSISTKYIESTSWGLEATVGRTIKELTDFERKHKKRGQHIQSDA